MTIFLSVRIFPPPTGMSAVLARTAGPFELAGNAALALDEAVAALPPWAGAPSAIPPLLVS
jgi:hypothetical protein